MQNLAIIGLFLLFMMGSRRVDAASLIKEFEGLSLIRYTDASGREHIGYGHLLREGEDWFEITQFQADTLLIEDMEKAVKCVDDFVLVPISAQQEAALVSFVYNVGCGAFAKSSLLMFLNGGEYQRAADEFPRWNQSAGKVMPGLVKRRKREREVFLT